MSVEITKPSFVDDEELEDVLQYLDDLRESGTINMFGAPAVLEQAFDEFNRYQCRDLVKYWMNTFPERHNDDG